MHGSLVLIPLGTPSFRNAFSISIVHFPPRWFPHFLPDGTGASLPHDCKECYSSKLVSNAYHAGGSRDNSKIKVTLGVSFFLEYPVQFATDAQALQSRLEASVARDTGCLI